MAKDSNIGWCHDTVNLWWGCEELSPACVNCYARTYDAMRGPLFDDGRLHWGKDSTRWLRVESALAEIRAANKLAKKTGERRRVFINSMSDFFEHRPELEDARLAAFKVFAECEHLDILLLTKRAEYAVDWLLALLDDWRGHAWCQAFERLWLGFTGENQFWFDRRWQQFQRIENIPAVIFCSYEPACGPLILPQSFLARGSEAWLIAGGESGAGRRDWDLGWLESVATQTGAAGVPLYVKQDSAFKPGLQGRISSPLWERKEFPVVVPIPF